MNRPSREHLVKVKPGDVLADRYRVIDTVGEGGMGIVFECKHLKLGTRVAVKMLLDDAAEDEEVRIRFDREARAAARLKSPHVARVLDVDETSDGRPFMVMEFLEGYGLDEIVDTQDQVPVIEAVDYILQACSGMAEAHAHGIVHRDLKPPNLFCSVNDGDAKVKVLDFGISKVLLEGENKGVTHTTTTFGTPTYMSPEQIQSAKNVDSRADIWSLGVILYELLVGFPPFDGDNPGAIIWSICSDNPKPPIAFRPDLPKELSDAVMAALEKNREYRFQNVVEFAEAIEPFGTEGVFQPPPASEDVVRRSRPSRREMLASLPGGPKRSVTHPPWTSSRRLAAIKRTRTALVVGVVSLVAVVGSGVAFIVWRGTNPVVRAESSSSPTPAAPATTSAEVGTEPELGGAPSASAPAPSGSASVASSTSASGSRSAQAPEPTPRPASPRPGPAVTVEPPPRPRPPPPPAPPAPTRNPSHL